MLNHTVEELQNLSGPVLLTGHTGFKGVWMAQYLQALGVEVAGFSLPPTSESLYMRSNLLGSIQENFGDITDFSVLQAFIKKIRPAAILHFAAQSLVRESYKAPVNTFSTNVMGTVNVLEVARHVESIKAILIVTTDKVYENRNTNEKFKESSPIFGNDPYSASKAAAENVVAAYRSINRVNRIPNISVMRAGNVIGGGDFSDNRLVPDIVRAKMHGKTLTVRNPESTRPWQHVLDPLAGYLIALTESLKNNTDLTLNFGPSERSLTVQEVIDISVNEWPELDVVLEAENNAVHEAKYLDLDSTAAKRILGWKPIFTQQEAIRRTLSWWNSYFAMPSSALDITNYEVREFISFQNSKL